MAKETEEGKTLGGKTSLRGQQVLTGEGLPRTDNNGKCWRRPLPEGTPKSGTYCKNVVMYTVILFRNKGLYYYYYYYIKTFTVDVTLYIVVRGVKV